MVQARPNTVFQGTETQYYTEELIRKTNIPYTFFRNSMYMEAIPELIGDALQTNEIRYPSGNGKVSFVSRADIEVFREELISYPMPVKAVDLLISMANGIKAGEFSYVDNTLEKLLGRKSFDLNGYIKVNLFTNFKSAPENMNGIEAGHLPMGIIGAPFQGIAFAKNGFVVDRPFRHFNVSFNIECDMDTAVRRNIFPCPDPGFLLIYSVSSPHSQMGDRFGRFIRKGHGLVKFFPEEFFFTA